MFFIFWQTETVIRFVNKGPKGELQVLDITEVSVRGRVHGSDRKERKPGQKSKELHVNANTFLFFFFFFYCGVRYLVEWEDCFHFILSKTD